MNLASIDLIKDLHEDECVEDKSEMLSWSSPQCSIFGIIDVKQVRTREHKHQHHNQLVD